MSDVLPYWTALPFGALVLSMAALPVVAPRLWEKHLTQVALVIVCAVPVAVYSSQHGLGQQVLHNAANFVTFITTLGALYCAAGGVFVSADFRATPAVNASFLLVGSVLANAIGTMGASLLLIRPLLRTNQQRKHVGHLVPFFILVVANAGGLLTPLGDPPLLVGFAEGVPFFWTLRLFPIWLLYVVWLVLCFYVVDRRAYARETAAALAHDEQEQQPLVLQGRRNIALLAAVVISAFFPPLWRELALVAIALAAYFGTPRELHERNGFGLGPLLELALLFGGLFVCLVPVETQLAALAPSLPMRHAYQLFWGTGLLSALLDNAPTYAAFAALARGLSQGQPHLVAGMSPDMLAAISVGSVVMGATTYIGNGPNLVIKSIAERAGLRMPGFLGYAAFAFVSMLPAHLLVTAALVWLER